MLRVQYVSLWPNMSVKHRGSLTMLGMQNASKKPPTFFKIVNGTGLLEDKLDWQNKIVQTASLLGMADCVKGRVVCVTVYEHMHFLNDLLGSITRVPMVFYSVLVSVSCPKALYHVESDNLFRITVVFADWLG